MVLIGADSVLKDGTLVHKVRTRDIGDAAKKHGRLVYSSCETAKFSVQDFLGERPEVSTFFDLTPPDFVSGYVTEEGQLAPDGVQTRLRDLQKEIYP